MIILLFGFMNIMVMMIMIIKKNKTIIIIIIIIIYGLATNCVKEGNVLFNDALNTFYLRLYGVRYMVKDHSDSKR